MLSNNLDIPQNVIIIGYGGHARVLADILKQQNGFNVIGYTDFRPTDTSDFPYLGDDSVIGSYSKNDISLVNGIGSTGLPMQRKEIYKRYADMGYIFSRVIHTRSLVSPGAELYAGVQIMGGTIINTGVVVKENCIVNTAATIDHDCVIGRHSHIAPGVVLSGGVTVGEDCHIGTGSIIIQGVDIGNSVLVGAGSLVTSNIRSGVKVYGSPAAIAE
jgi:sugar O-acyltransferase (sialic acid O-acetyltransferase NeuD family)